VRRIDGALISASVSAHVPLLYQHVLSNQWDRAIRLCRFVRDDALWACLAAMAVAAKDLNTADIAYAAIEEVEKVQFINAIKKVPTEEGRSAELCLFRRRPEEAEAILLQAYPKPLTLNPET
jgi:intraflagellar transport protein 80